MRRTVKTLSIVLALSLLGLIVAGCGVPQDKYTALETQLASVQKDLDASKVQLDSIQKQFDATKAQLDSTQKDRDTTKTQLTSAQADIKKLQDNLASQSTTLADTQKQASQLQSRLNTVLDTKITQYYQFNFMAIQTVWSLPFTLKTYLDFKERPRPTSATMLPAMATDTGANALLDILVHSVKDSTVNSDLRQSDIANLVAKFVQTMPRTNKDVLTPYDDYPRYPVETLFEQGGDSQDTAILTAAFLKKLDYDVVLFAYDAQKHMAVGVNTPSVGYSWENAGKRYYYLETTGENLKLGDCPPTYREVRPTIYPVTSP